MIAVLVLATAAVHAPNALVGRWEENIRDCKTPLDLRDDHGWMNIKPRRIEWFEGATDDLVGIKEINAHRYVLKVHHRDPESSQFARYNVQLSHDAKKLSLSASNWSGRFFRCSRVDGNAPNK